MFYTKKNYAFVGLSQEESTQLLTNDDLFLSTTDDKGDNFRSSPTSRTLDKMAYFSSDDTMESIHPCAYTVKMQHKNDTPAYKDILKSSTEERSLWDAARVKELKPLHDLG